MQEPERERKESGKMPPVRDFLNMTGSLLRLFKDFIHAFRIKYLDIEVTFGLNDPTYTGIITGFLHVIGLSRTGHNIRWRADFTGQEIWVADYAESVKCLNCNLFEHIDIVKNIFIFSKDRNLNKNEQKLIMR